MRESAAAQDQGKNALVGIAGGVQHDVARQLTGKVRGEAEQSREGGWCNHQPVTQPGLSPDVKVNQMRLFSSPKSSASLKSRVWRDSHGTIGDLVDDVKRTFDEYDPETLDRMRKNLLKR